MRVKGDFMRQKVLSFGLSVIMLLVCLTSVISAEVENDDVASITISCNEGMVLSGKTVASGFEATSVNNFFEDNEINYDYYRDWLYKQETESIYCWYGSGKTRERLLCQ